MLSPIITLAKAPVWLDAPAKWCKKSDLCAVGQGESYAQAAADSRQAISKIFETKIKSVFKSTESMQGTSSTLEMSEEINEATEGVISGIEILERYETDDTTYVIAAINKHKTATTIKGKIEKIDEEIKSALEKKRSNTVLSVKRLLKKRFPLEQSYTLLTNVSLPAPTTLVEIEKLSKQLTKGLVVYVNITGASNRQLSGELQEILITEGFKLASTERDKRITHTVKGEIKEKEEYINVDGFKKFTFTLQVYAVNKSGSKTGAIDHNITTVGRSHKQCLEKALPKLKEYIQNNIENLNFE